MEYCFRKFFWSGLIFVVDIYETIYKILISKWYMKYHKNEF